MDQQTKQTNDGKNKKPENENANENRSREPCYPFMYVASITANLSSVACGMCMGWTSPIIPLLIANVGSQSPLNAKLDNISESWIVASMALGAIFTPFIAGQLADQIGRKLVLLSSALAFIAAFVLMLIAKEPSIMILGRVVQGCGAGFALAVVPMYVGEISADSVRGAIGSLLNFFMTVGMCAVVCIGPYVSYYAIQYLCISVPILFLLTFSFMPESPYYYVIKNKKPEAFKALKFLRRQNDETLKALLTEIEDLVTDSMANKNQVKTLFGNRTNRKALIICLGVIVFQQLSGMDAVLCNIQKIFSSAEMDIDGATAASIFAGVQMVAAGIYPVFADKLGRKTYLLVSSCFMGIGLLMIGTFFYSKFKLGVSDALNWLPVPSLMLYVIMLSIGFAPLPWTLVGEMFAPNVKPLAASSVASISWLGGFVTTLTYPSLEKAGAYYAFWMYGIFCLPFGFLFSWFFVMETRGLSLQEIQKKLAKESEEPQ